MSLKTDLDHTKKLFKNFKSIKKFIFIAGKDYERYIEKQWRRGKNGNNKTFKPLSEGYKKSKTEAGKSGFADNKLSGALIRSLSTTMNSDLQAKVFLGETEKAEWVAERNDDVGIWDVSKKQGVDMLKGIYKRLQPK